MGYINALYASDLSSLAVDVIGLHGLLEVFGFADGVGIAEVQRDIKLAIALGGGVVIVEAADMPDSRQFPLSRKVGEIVAA